MRTVLVLTMLVAGAVLARDLAATTADAAPTVTFYGDGTLRSSTVYVEGIRSGPTEQFYSDGAPEWRGTYVRGERDGDWTFWTREGPIDAERSGRYVGGVLVD